MNTKNVDLNVIKKFIERRKNEGFAESTIITEIKLLNKFYCWLNDNMIERINNKLIEDYINNLKCGKELLAKTRCTLHRLYNYVTNGNYAIVTKSKISISINTIYLNYINSYLSIIENKFDKTTVNNKKVFLKHFFHYLDEKKIINLCDLKQHNVTEFLNNCISKYSKAYFNKIAYFIREYLNYLFNSKIITFTGNDVIPKLNTCYSTPILTTYSNEEINKVLNSIDKTTKIGKRDYLIILLLATYGIRIGDICNMKINSFDFNSNKLIFVQKKTNKMLELPIINEIKFAFVDYLKNSRPNIESEFLLITHTKPYRNYDKRSLRNVVPKYLKLANINTSGKKTGAHTLRHSLASNMLSNGSNIKEISDILGHNYISTSNLYLTIDNKKLQELSLELPNNNIEKGDFNE